MSVFQDDVEKIKKAIEYFNSLKEERKAFLVSNITTPNAYTSEELDYLKPLLEAIQNDISSHNESTIGNKLFELGMNETYAILFVKNVIKDAPTFQYQLKIISQIKDEQFKELLPNFVKSLWVQRLPIPEVSKKYNLANDQLNALLNVFRNIMNEFLRRDSSEETITKKLSDGGFSKDKLDVFLNTLKINSEIWRNMLVFSNSQDAFFGVQELKQQNQTILETLKEILQILREFKNPTTNQVHYQ